MNSAEQLINKRAAICPIFVSIVFFGLLFVSGCAYPDAVVKIYTGTDKPDSETTLLKCDYHTFITDVTGPEIRKIWDCDNKLIWEGNAWVFRLTPGIYSFEVYYNIGGGCPNGAIEGAAAGFAQQTASQKTTQIIKAKCDTNREYILRCKKTGLFVWQWEAIYWVEDLQSGEVISGTKP